jgi:hypothetical protein
VLSHAVFRPNSWESSPKFVHRSRVDRLRRLTVSSFVPLGNWRLFRYQVFDVGHSRTRSPVSLVCFTVDRTINIAFSTLVASPSQVHQSGELEPVSPLERFFRSHVLARPYASCSGCLGRIDLSPTHGST